MASKQFHANAKAMQRTIVSLVIDGKYREEARYRGRMKLESILTHEETADLWKWCQRVFVRMGKETSEDQPPCF